MSHENYNYDKIQKSLVDKGWTGSVSDIKSIIQIAHNESTVLTFINELSDLILKPSFNDIRPNFYNTSDRVELFENIKKTILSYYIEPCTVEKFSSELYEDITVELANMSLLFSISGNSSFTINKRLINTTKPEITTINFYK